MEILFKNSSDAPTNFYDEPTDAPAAPTTSEVSVGEIAVNANVGRLFTKLSNGQIVTLGEDWQWVVGDPITIVATTQQTFARYAFTPIANACYLIEAGGPYSGKDTTGLHVGWNWPTNLMSGNKSAARLEVPDAAGASKKLYASSATASPVLTSPTALPPFGTQIGRGIFNFTAIMHTSATVSGDFTFTAKLETFTSGDGSQGLVTKSCYLRYRLLFKY